VQLQPPAPVVVPPVTVRQADIVEAAPAPAPALAPAPFVAPRRPAKPYRN
jgi:hypothetical protein